ncbi:phage portal protein [Jhaorihella thermophila]
MRALRDLGDWQAAELVRKKTEACLVGVVFGAEEAEQGMAPSVVDADNRVIEAFESGLIAYARGAKDIRFNQPGSGTGIREWLQVQMHLIAAGFRVPEIFGGRLSAGNDLCPLLHGLEQLFSQGASSADRARRRVRGRPQPSRL